MTANVYNTPCPAIRVGRVWFRSANLSEKSITFLNPALKQRLVGATVLVALGVIFIPMLLERSNDDARLSVSMEIPPSPPIDFINPASEASEIAEIKPMPSMEEALRPIKQRQQADDASAAKKPEKSTAPAANKQQDSKQGAQWIVQIGSFSREVNADVLKDKLRSAGFAAYVESATVNTGPIYRVRLGPLEERAAAEAMVKKLDQSGGYKGIVIATNEGS